MPPPAFPVTLQIGAASYQKNATIHVTIMNQSSQVIFFADHQTNCTVLLLEQQGANSWERVAPCKLLIKTRIHSLGGGADLAVEFTPSRQWSVGRYRARLDYGVGSTSGLSAPKTAFSSEFQVG